MRLSALLVLLVALTGCSTFSTDQLDDRYENGNLATRVRTKVKSKALFDSDSALTKFKATQTEKSQGAEVGSLTQKATSTNAIEVLKTIDSILGKVQ